MRPSSWGGLRAWWPALMMVLVAIGSAAVLYADYARLQRVLERTVSGVESVTESRRRLHLAYIIQQGQAAGDPTFRLGSAPAEATAAAHALRNWLAGRSTVAGLEAAPPEHPEVIALGQAYEQALATFRSALGATGSDAVRMRQAFSSADRAASALESAVHAALRARIRSQAMGSALRIGGWGALLLVVGLGLVYARNARRAAELERATTEARLSRLRALAPVGIIECDEGGRILAVNVAWVRLAGGAAAGWEGRPWWDALVEVERHAGRSLWAGTIRTRTEQSGEFRLESPGEGGPVWVLVRTAPDAGSETEGRWVATFTDVTARRGIEEQLQHARKLEAVGRLAGAVAHDFNNLLTSMGGFAELGRRKLPPGEPLAADLLEIERSAERGRALTRQLLAFARQERIQPEILDLRDVVGGLDRMLQRLVRADIDVRLDMDPDPVPVLADRGQLEQVVINLVVNAGDAIAESGRIRVGVGEVEVEESFRGAGDDIPPGRYALLSVADNGCGIPAAIRERIFEPFYTTKERGKGTGLGLSTVWGIVRQSGGHIHLSSEEGRGTDFRIYIPSTEASAARRETGMAAPEADHAVGGTILVVEDQAAVRRLAVRVLQLAGWAVLEATDGREALEVLDGHAGPVDLLITDVIMTGMGGPELLEAARGRGYDFPALFVSGYADSDLDLGPAPFLQKPFSPGDLVRKVRQVLAR